MRLTEAKIRSAKPKTNATGKPIDNWISDGGGLYLRVLPSGLKQWIIRRKRNGKALPTVHVGNYPDVGLKQARHDATGYQLQRNISTMTVMDLVDRYRLDVLSNHAHPKHLDGYLSRAVIPLLGNRRVREIETAELVVMIRNYHSSKAGTTGTRARDQFRSVLKQMFGLAVELGWRPDNPAGAITSRVTGYTYEPRQRIITCNEVRLLWADTAPNAAILRFLLLTGVRIGEAQNAAPESSDGGVWVIPDSLSKNRKPHKVFLTDTALAQLPLPVCTSTGVQAWLRRWCDRHGIEERFTPHDLRRTFATWMNEAGIEPYVVEKCLNHTLEGIMGVYNHAEYWEQRVAAYRAMDAVLQGIV